MSVSQEREEASGHCETLRPESAAHSCVQQSSKPTHSDGGPQTPRPPSPVPSCVSMKSDASIELPPKFSSEPVPSGLKETPTAAWMSVSQEREEAAGHCETLRPESAAHSCVQQSSKPTHSDGG
ncbi:hypothetical protein AALO_G00091120 [Alosa alosa]|uniref:Uncharacterized protein n=1 Tax=Alosa alosa TaxID=278164 RepID=A0AAV6GRL7_9TELE|nr:hypothetical protein AALO_G00091120 [Alosa alosa]